MTTATLSREQYIAVQDCLVALGQVVARLPLAEFLAQIERADSVGAVLDPTLYRAAAGKLDAVRDLAFRFRAVQAEALKQAPTLAGPIVESELYVLATQQIALAGLFLKP
jgi:hypothetical protein